LALMMIAIEQVIPRHRIEIHGKASGRTDGRGLEPRSGVAADVGEPDEIDR
jgi:hypothetical protein